MTHRESFPFTPNVERPLSGDICERICGGGMGGSAAAAAALAYIGAARLSVHENYDLPEDPPDGALYLAVSYSGNTEETLSFAEAAIKNKLPLAAVTSGGALADFAQKNDLPLSLVPQGLVPRNALPEMLAAELALLKKSELLTALQDAIPSAEALEREAGALAEALEGHTPIFYCSERNTLLARLGKMFWNESAKRPAFTSVVPARNHDELQGFDPKSGMNERFCVVMLKDFEDESRTARRMAVIETLLPEMRLPVFSIALEGSARLERLMRFWHLAKETTARIARMQGVDPDTNPITDQFKTLLAQRS